ncbi:hypothetical protein ACQCVB_03400 [Fictibacillus phosphorivorans]|uniref:hypothetical protein n=1 Tax=Fictibacillus TaxID=1329200 RepID=UPI0018CDAD52|nr:hypothetical protein [Fictibacillus sp. 23RED33]MBH0173914.1 hypothetical protein [Fictibacillus sp. 23RED33]
MKKFGYGLMVMVFGFIIIMFTASIYDNGSDGPITGGTLYNGLMMLIVSILFFCGTMTVCTLLIIDALKKK